MGESFKEYLPVTANIIEGANNFSAFLACDIPDLVRSKISIIPNFVKDILDVALEYKKVKIQDKQFKRKAEIAEQFIKLQDNNSKRHFSSELARINSNEKTAIKEIEQRKECTLAQIKANENIEITKLTMQYKMKMKKLNEQADRFSKILKEDQRRFDLKTQERQEIIKELTHIISLITLKISSDQASDKDINMLCSVSDLLIQFQKDSVDIEEEFLKFFIKLANEE